MSGPPVAPDFEIIRELSGTRLCDECSGEYAVLLVRIGVVQRGLCDSCARQIGGDNYFKPNEVSNASPSGAPQDDVQTTYTRTTTTESAPDFGSCRIDDLFDDPIDHSIRSDKDFPRRAREYLDVLGRIQGDIGMKTWELSNMARCFYRCQGHTYKCTHDHLTTHYRRDRNERKCPRCNRAYRFRMADEMVTLAKDFGCRFLMRFVFTVPQEDRDIDLSDLLDRVNRTLRSFFSDADILPYWTVPHEFSSRYPPRRNPHVEVFMIPLGIKRTWYERELKQWRDFEKVTVWTSRAVRVDELIQYDKWMLADEKIDALGKEIDALRQTLQPTLDLPAASDFTREYVEMQVAAIKNRMKSHKRLEGIRKLWRRQFPDCKTEVNVFYNYVGLRKAQFHTIPYALRPPFNPEYVVVFSDDDKVVYEIDKKTHETIELDLDEVVETFRYDYYNTKTHRIHRMGALSNTVWRHYFRALTGKEPPPLKAEGDEEPDIICGECEGDIVEYWSNDLIHHDWLVDVFIKLNIKINILPGTVDWFAFVQKLGHTKSTNTQGSIFTSATAEGD